ncbi:hypothetical protein IWW48_005922 [Coemansia sp. RSA 1200]|nr:hypothetical protein IWW48_005922 [Coemansia sp. RSA 1200]
MGGSGIGPQIPPEIAARLGIKNAEHANSSSSDEERGPETIKRSSGVIGPAMPPVATSHFSSDDSCSDDDSEAIGPSTALSGYTDAQALNQTIDAIEERAHKRQSDTDDAKAVDTHAQRPDWMLVPPDSETRRTGLFDKSWTRIPGKDTDPTRESEEADNSPEMRTKKSKKKKNKEDPIEETPDMRRRRVESEDKARWVDEYNKRVRPKSLLEMHVEARRGKSKSSKEEKRGQRKRHGNAGQAKKDDNDDGDDDGWKRRRFDRDRDLASAPRHTSTKAQREILNTMGFLSDKYAPGKGGSFM